MSNKSTAARRASQARSNYAAMKRASDQGKKQLACPHEVVNPVEGFEGMIQCAACGAYGPF
jgi:hypothetical protein